MDQRISARKLRNNPNMPTGPARVTSLARRRR
jgi:hypothetical protein